MPAMTLMNVKILMLVVPTAAAIALVATNVAAMMGTSYILTAMAAMTSMNVMILMADVLIPAVTSLVATHAAAMKASSYIQTARPAMTLTSAVMEAAPSSARTRSARTSVTV